MRMFELSAIASFITAMGDFLFGWLLALPRDLAIVGIALVTSLVLTLARKWCTNQELLGRCAADLRRLKQLIRQAKARRYGPPHKRSEVQRMKGTMSLIKLKQLAAEGRVLLVALVPLAVLATWGMARLEYLPPVPGQELTLRAYYPLSSVGKLTHLVPREGLELKGGSSAVQQVRADEDGGGNGVAEWVLVAREPLPATELTIRHQERAVTHTLRMDGRIYEPPIQRHDEDSILATEIVLTPSRFLGVVPGAAAIGLPPWVLAYLLLALALVYPLRWLMRVW
jgi:hypothetical protein